MTPKKGSPRSVPRDFGGPARRNEPPEPDLIGDIGRALRSGEPLDLLGNVSALMAIVDPRAVSPFERTQPASKLPTLADLVGTFVEVERVETTAMLTVIGELTADDMTRARIRRELAHRRADLPGWLTRLDEAECYRAVEMVHVLGDGDNVVLGVRLAEGHELSVVIYIDHNLGTLVKDAFVVPEPLDDLIVHFRQANGDDPDTRWEDLRLADAKVRITDAIKLGAMTFPPCETDTWPMCRPLVEWVTRQLPDGGTGYVRPEWSEPELAQLADRFFSSPFGQPLDTEDDRNLLESILWFGTNYGPGDPRRWSPVSVEIILEDWIPRKIVADVAYLSKAPVLLAAFIRFCHAERGISASLTEQTLDAVDRYAPSYQRAIRSSRPQGPAALLAAMGVLDVDDEYDDDDEFEYDEDEDNEDALLGLLDVPEIRQLMLASLAAAVGGPEALARLDDRPLPDEAFAWDGIPPDIHAVVTEVLELCDGCCDTLLDDEYRTACRRLLAAAAAGDPNVFRRKGRTTTAAAAICWIIGKANDLFTVDGGGMLMKDLNVHFGEKQGGRSRATALLRAAGVPDPHAVQIQLGSPRYLVSTQRADIVELFTLYGDDAADED